MIKINYIGLKKYDESEVKKIKELAERYSSKIDRKYPDSELEFHIKSINSEGKEKHYFIKLRLNAPSFKYDAEQDDWDLTRAVHKAFQNLENEINKK